MCGCGGECRPPAGEERWKVVARAFAQEFHRVTGKHFQASRWAESFKRAADQIVCPASDLPEMARDLAREYFASPEQEVRERGYPVGWFAYRIPQLIVVSTRQRAQIDRLRAEDERRRREEAARAQADPEYNARAALAVAEALRKREAIG